MSSQDGWNHNLYSPERFVDAPVSLQLVGRRYDDEKIFEAFELIRGAIGLPFASFP
jgi:amidase